MWDSVSCSCTGRSLFSQLGTLHSAPSNKTMWMATQAATLSRGRAASSGMSASKDTKLFSVGGPCRAIVASSSDSPLTCH